MMHSAEKRAFRRSGSVCPPQMPHCQECRITNVNARGKDPSLNGGSDGTRTRDLLRDRQAFQPTELQPANSLKMISRSLHSLAVSCTAFYVLRRDRASFST